jgi:hypothetical protein
VADIDRARPRRVKENMMNKRVVQGVATPVAVTRSLHRGFGLTLSA